MKRFILVVAIGIITCTVLLAGSTASAGPIAYGSFSGTVINFDNLAGSNTLGAGEVLANQYSGLGVTFTVPNFNAYATNGVLATDTSLNSDPNVIWVNQGGGSSGAVGMNINFSTPQSMVGLYFEISASSTATIAAYNGGTLLESLTSGLSPGGLALEGFLALADTNITKVVVYSAPNGGQNWNFTVDDLKFNGVAAAPEPGSLLLLGIGLAGLARLRRGFKK